MRQYEYWNPARQGGLDHCHCGEKRVQFEYVKGEPPGDERMQQQLGANQPADFRGSAAHRAAGDKQPGCEQCTGDEGAAQQ